MRGIVISELAVYYCLRRGIFFQILQGDKSLLLNLFEIIKGDTRHDGIVLMSQDIETGCSNGYAADILGKIIKHQKKTPQEYT